MSVVQVKFEQSTATAHTMTFDTNPVAGNAILVYARRSNAASDVPVATDNRGNTYSVVTPGGFNTGGRRVWIFKAENVNGAGSVTVTLTFPLQVTIKWHIVEVNNVPATGAIEDSAIATFALGSAPTSLPVTTTVSGDLILSYLIINEAASAGAITPNGGETEDHEDPGFIQLQHKVAGAPGDYTASWALGTPSSGGYALLALKSSGGVGSNGNAGGSIDTVSVAAPAATATSNVVDVIALRTLSFDVNNKPSRLTTKVSATAVSPADFGAAATAFRWAVTGGSGLVTIDPDGRLSCASTVTQITWAWFNGSVWSGDVIWDVRGLFPFCAQPVVEDKTYVSGSAISSEAFAPLFNDLDTIASDLTYSLIGPTIPGVSIDSDTGLLTGTPSTPGQYLDLLVRCTDLDGSFAQTNQFDRIVEAAPNPPFFFGFIGPSFAFPLDETFADINCGANFQFCTSFTLTGSLPAGLSFNTSTGVISGQPTENGLFSLLVTGNGTGAPANSNPFSLEIISLDGDAIVTDMPVITVTAPGVTAEARALWMKVDMPVDPGWLVVS